MRDHYKGWMVSYNVHFRESTLATMLRKRRINGESRENDETIEIKQVKDKGAWTNMVAADVLSNYQILGLLLRQNWQNVLMDWSIWESGVKRNPRFWLDYLEGWNYHWRRLRKDRCGRDGKKFDWGWLSVICLFIPKIKMWTRQMDIWVWSSMERSSMVMKIWDLLTYRWYSKPRYWERYPKWWVYTDNTSKEWSLESSSV